MSRARSSIGLGSVLLRSSSTLPLAPGIVALLVVNTVLRGHPWDHEWGWAIYQAGFVTVFLGPLSAGIGVWDGTQVARSRPTIEAAGRPIAARAAAWAAIVAVVAAIYLGALIVLGAVLKAGGILDGPGWSDLSPIPGVVALCGAWAAVGVAIGYRWPNPLLAPLSAAVAFVLTLVLYLAQPFLITVGGATASTLFLEPRRSIQVGQLVLFAAIAAAAVIGLPTHRAGDRPRVERTARALAPLVAVLATGYLVTSSGIAFVDRHRTLTCDGERPRICVAAPYRDRIDWPRPYLLPYLRALDHMGIEPPTMFAQGWDRPPGQGAVPDELLLGHPPKAGPMGSVGPGGSAVLGAYLPDFCEVYLDPKVQQAYDAVTWWLTSITDPSVLDDPAAPHPLASADHETISAYLQDAFATLSTCAP